MTHWRTFVLAGLAASLVCVLGFAAPAAASPGDHPKLDPVLNGRATHDPGGRSRVIVTLTPGFDASADAKRLGGQLGRRLPLINGQVVELSNGQLKRLADSPAVASIHWDRPTGGELNRAAVAIGARAVQHTMGLDGAGVGVAIIDSGVTSWHDDLTYNGTNAQVRVVGGQRVAAFVDFVNGRTTPYDDNGHGTHVAGIIAGNGYDSHGARAGVAPAAHLVSLKVLDDHGAGYISNVIAALDWAIRNKTAYNIRVINLSVGAAVTESYRTDPLTLAAKRAVDAGIVVVTAAGNLGKNAAGETQYGAITAPGNAPWVLTVGAFNHNGTVTRVDDEIAAYSSRGPSAVDYVAKPDVVAPGTAIASLSDQNSLFYRTRSAYLLSGTVSTAYKPYLSLTGTSMAAPMVTGTVALMVQANPRLTPNLVKAVIEYTAQDYDYDALTQGAGFLNTRGAVQLAQFFATARAGERYPHQKPWSRTIIWDNHQLTGGVLKPAGTAWATNIVWGTSRADNGDNIVWGTRCGSACDNIVWGTSLLDSDNIVWGTLFDGDNIVWGTGLLGDNIVWGTLFGGDNIVWGTMLGDNIVWGTTCGGNNCDNIVWGTALADLDNIVWGTVLRADNIVWGTSGDADNIVWGTVTAPDNLTWGFAGEEALAFDADGAVLNFDETAFESLFPVDEQPTSADSTTSTTTTITTTVTGLLGGF